MKKVKIVLWMIIFFLLSKSTQAGTFQIESLDRSGKIIFSEATNACGYRVEWAPTPGGPWTNTWDTLNYIATTGDGSVTSSVPMFFRVIAIEKIAMALIPSGTNSGTNPLAAGESYDSSTYPSSYSLTVDDFYMDTTSITKSDWDEVYNWALANGYNFDNPGAGKGDEHPVCSISWYDALKWCNARSEREGRSPCYTVSNQVYRVGATVPDVDYNQDGYRLPRGYEWEYAARSGLANTRFPRGNTISHNSANYYADPDNYSYDMASETGFIPAYHIWSLPFTSPVRTFPPNGYGLYDMDGNIMNWCWELHYTSAREIRGGAFNQPPTFSRCGQIGWDLATSAKIGIGIRCIRRAP